MFPLTSTKHQHDVIIPIINLSSISTTTAVHYHKRMTIQKEIRFLLLLSSYQHYGRNTCATNTTAAEIRITIQPIDTHFVNHPLNPRITQPLTLHKGEWYSHQSDSMVTIMRMGLCFQKCAVNRCLQFLYSNCNRDDSIHSLLIVL